MVRTIAVIWTGIAAGLTAIGTIYMMTMAAGGTAINVLLLVSAVLCGAVCVGLATERRHAGRPRVLSPYSYHEPVAPVRQLRPDVARKTLTGDRLPNKMDRKVRPQSKPHPAGHQAQRLA